MSNLKSAIDKLEEAVKDLTSLHVQTYSGTVNFTKSATGTFESIRTELTTQATAQNVQLELKLESLVKFDGDSYNFIASGDVSDALLKLHKDALDTGMQTRLGLIQLIKGLL